MRYLSVMAVLVLAACAAEEGSWHDLGGANIGKPKWARIDPSTSRLHLPPAFHPVGRVTSGSLSDRTFEDIDLATGYVGLEEAGGGGFVDDIPSGRFRAVFDGAEILGDTVDGNTLEPKRKHPVTYAELTLGEYPCLAFRRPIGPTVSNLRGGRSAHEGIVTGIYCDTSGEGNFRKRALGYVRQIRLRRTGESLDEPGGLPAEPLLKSEAEVRAYLDRSRRAIRNALSAYNREHRALVGSDDALDVKEIVSLKLRGLNGDRVFVETSFTVCTDGSNWIAGAGTLLFELRWVDDELTFIGHDSL